MEKTKNHQVSDDLANYFIMMMKEEVKIQNKEKGTNVEVKFNIDHTTIGGMGDTMKHAVCLSTLFIYSKRD